MSNYLLLLYLLLNVLLLAVNVISLSCLLKKCKATTSIITNNEQKKVIQETKNMYVDMKQNNEKKSKSNTLISVCVMYVCI